jgi:hypothetical protein
MVKKTSKKPGRVGPTWWLPVAHDAANNARAMAYTEKGGQLYVPLEECNSLCIEGGNPKYGYARSLGWGFYAFQQAAIEPHQAMALAAKLLRELRSHHVSLLETPGAIQALAAYDVFGEDYPASLRAEVKAIDASLRQLRGQKGARQAYLCVMALGHTPEIVAGPFQRIPHETIVEHAPTNEDSTLFKLFLEDDKPRLEPFSNGYSEKVRNEKWAKTVAADLMDTAQKALAADATAYAAVEKEYGGPGPLNGADEVEAWCLENPDQADDLLRDLKAILEKAR